MAFEEKFWPGEGAFYISFNDDDIPSFDSLDFAYDLPTIVALYGGSRTNAIREMLTDEEIVSKCLDELSQVLDMEIPTPLESYVSNWKEDPYSYGSCTYVFYIF